jgi:hypothetical protein
MRFLSWVALAGVAVALGCAENTASTPAPAAQAAVSPGNSVTGTIQNYTRTPSGDVDGFTLDSGQRVRVPPELSAKVSEQFPPNLPVQVTGRRVTDPDGRTVIEADQLTNPTTHATLDLAAARGAAPSSAVGGSGTGASGTTTPGTGTSGTGAEPQNPLSTPPATQPGTAPPPTQR